MCGIIGIVSNEDVVPMILEGLKFLEYRGYDSVGIATIRKDKTIDCVKSKGHVDRIFQSVKSKKIYGNIGIGHTRWATHGKASIKNAHPHLSTNHAVAIVHNGIIENHIELRKKIPNVQMKSDTDSEIIAHLIYDRYSKKKNMFESILDTTKELKGTFAICVLSIFDSKVYAISNHLPLVVGKLQDRIGYMISSDSNVASYYSSEITYMESGNIAEISDKEFNLYSFSGNRIDRKSHIVPRTKSMNHFILGEYRHYMQKEIFEQPNAISDTIYNRIISNEIHIESISKKNLNILKKTEGIQIVACGTSYHAGLIAKYWIEEISKIPCSVEIASEYKSRNVSIHRNTLFISISQSGETADTIDAIKRSREKKYLSRLCICNTKNSMAIRESDMYMLTHAGVEVGVASTKAFSSQLIALLMIAILLIKDREEIMKYIEQIERIHETLRAFLDDSNMQENIRNVANRISNDHSILILGRGIYYPISMETALKIKETSYIHAEAYAIGEIKHGPLAFIDKNVHVIVLAPTNHLFEKTLNNIHEITARNGNVFAVSDDENRIDKIIGEENMIYVPKHTGIISQFLYIATMQLLAYEIACIKGTDIDKPRNLAKAVTVE